ncbi:MAG: hypothetical protein AAF557_21105 [Pseudomonadota bacterium]
MKLLALVASAALAIAPLGAMANDTQVAAASAAPAPGGVAKSSIDVDPIDAELIALIVAAGGVLVIAGVVFAITSDDDGNPAVSTTSATGTN